MGNVGVRVSRAPIFAEIADFKFAAGSGKSVIWYVHLLAVLQKEPMGFIQFHYCRGRL